MAELVGHVWIKHEDGYVCDHPGCFICAGLQMCKVCGAMEGALRDVCPGRELSQEEIDADYESNVRKWREEAEEYRRNKK